MKKHAAPSFAVILLLLPVLYVGSYLALVDPNIAAAGERNMENRSINYRAGGLWIDSFFWPLEQIDRKVRRRLWYYGDNDW